jgi:hypothetical protein
MIPLTLIHHWHQLALPEYHAFGLCAAKVQYLRDALGLRQEYYYPF